MTSVGPNQEGYFPHVDGLRAVAVFAVLLFHAKLGCPGGYIGVDVFFVISGYLITGLILRAVKNNQFSILEFWERRMRRIFPALALVVISSLMAGWIFFLPDDLNLLSQSVVAQAALASNIYFWLGSGYFDQASELKPLLHTWSLAVEEQFYLLFPFIVVFLSRFRRSVLVWFILLMGGVSFCLSVYCSYHYPALNFYVLPTRAWELLAGSFLAATATQRTSSSHRIYPQWIAETLGWIGLLAIICALIIYDDKTKFPGVYAILPCAGAMAIIWADSRTSTRVGRLLASSPFVSIGLISYSLYLWHWPLLVFAKYLYIDPLPKVHRVLLLMATLVLSFLSWRFVEIPFRKRVLFKTRIQIFSFVGIATVLMMLTGFSIYKLKGVPSRMPAAAMEYGDGTGSDYGRVQELSYKVGLKQALAGDFIQLGDSNRNSPIDFLLWGDSHAAAVVSILDRLCKEYEIRGVAAIHAGSAPLVGYENQWEFSLRKDSGAFSDAVVEYVRHNGIKNTLLVAKWGGYIGESGSAKIGESLEITVDTLEKAGSDIWIMRQVPKPQGDVPRTLAIGVLQGRPPEELGLTSTEYQRQIQLENPAFLDLIKRFPKATVLDPSGFFLTQGARCLIAKDGKALFCDSSHLSSAGATVLRPLFEPIFRRIKSQGERLEKQ